MENIAGQMVCGVDPTQSSVLILIGSLNLSLTSDKPSVVVFEVEF